jgi:hypothetical protein
LIIFEGTGEIQRLIIARGLLDDTRADLKQRSEESCVGPASVDIGFISLWV